MAGRSHWRTEEAYLPDLQEPGHLATMLTRPNRSTKQEFSGEENAIYSKEFRTLYCAPGFLFCLWCLTRAFRRLRFTTWRESSSLQPQGPGWKSADIKLPLRPKRAVDPL